MRVKKTDSPQEVAITVSTQTFVRLLLLIVGSVALILTVHKTAHALLLIFIGFFLALALNSPVHWVERHLPSNFRGNRALATSLSFLLVVVLLGVFIASLVPPLVRQTESFVNATPNLVQNLRTQNGEVGQFIRKYHLQKQVDSLSSQISNRLKNSGGVAFSTAQKVGSSAFALLTILVLTFMMLVEGPRWLAIARDLIPDNRQLLYDRLSHDMYRVVKGYINGQVVLAAIAAVLITPALLFLHISYPAALMVVIFICGLIPMVGHTIGATIVTTVALFHSITAAIIILAYYILYQQIENYLVQPRIQSNTTNMSPLLVFSSLLIGVSFGGLIGGLVAIPIGGCIRILVLEYLRSKHILSTPQFDAATAETK